MTPSVKIDYTFVKTWYKNGASMTQSIAGNRYNSEVIQLGDVEAK